MKQSLDLPQKDSGQGGEKTELKQNYLKKSTAYLGMICCLIFGLVAGSLLGEFLHPTTTPSQSSVKSNATAQAQRPKLSPEQLKHLGELEQALTKDPKNQGLWIELGNLYFDNNKAFDAIKAYEHALSLGQPTADLLTDLGIMYREIDRFEDALFSFQQAQSLDPKHLQSRLNAGIVLYYDLASKEAALASFEEALRLRGDLKLNSGESLSTLVAKIKNEIASSPKK
ncbi:MAG: hypothetical protein IJS50_03455 [Desulfovibrio sp.]|nr:hypothetical protein [Desulfovibrio sp.]